MSTEVYFLGAGFSRYGDFPAQAEILNRVRDLNLDPFLLPPGTYDRIVEDKKTVDSFLIKVFSQPRASTLEDVFTLLDLSISCRDRDQEAILEAEVYLWCQDATRNTVPTKGVRKWPLPKSWRVIDGAADARGKSQIPRRYAVWMACVAKAADRTEYQRNPMTGAYTWARTAFCPLQFRTNPLPPVLQR